MKLLTFTIPCYNSQDYMRHCIESILPGGEDVEILIVDDGSKDDTAAIADEYAEKYPTIVKAIHQENGGHGEAVNAGIRNATGLYFKVVDSDDWVDWNALPPVLQIQGFPAENYLPDGFFRVLRYMPSLPQHTDVPWTYGFRDLPIPHP